MISHKSWRDPWQPVIPGYNVNRFELLADMWAVADWADRLGTARMPVPPQLLENLAQHRVLNISQIGYLLNRSRVAARGWVNRFYLADYFESPAVMGKFDWRQLPYLQHIMIKLYKGEEVPRKEIAQLTVCGDIAIISLLTGIPINTIRRAKKGLAI